MLPYSLYVHSVPQPLVTVNATNIRGSSVILTCEATLNPQIDVVRSISLSWGGPRILISDEPYSVVESGFGLHYSSSLTIFNFKKRDKGEYTCTVRVAGSTHILGAVITKSISELPYHNVTKVNNVF